MPPATSAKAPPDTPEREGSTEVSRIPRCPILWYSVVLCVLLFYSGAYAPHFTPQRLEVQRVSARQRANHRINRRHERKQFDAHDFAKPTLQSVSCHRRMTKSRNDHAHTRAMQRGSDVSHLELGGANSLPLNAYCLKVSLTRQSRRASKSKTVRRRRTSTGASP